MFARTLKYLRQCVRLRKYVMTLHAQDEMEADGLGVYDVEHCVLTGRIVDRQQDAVTLEWKYRVHGMGVAGQPVEVVVRRTPTGKMVVITVYVS